jgi:hypothetical protein
MRGVWSGEFACLPAGREFGVNNFKSPLFERGEGESSILMSNIL